MNNNPVDRCTLCCANRAQYDWMTVSHLCIDCLYRRLKSIDPCYKVMVSLVADDANEDCMGADSDG
jgi:hypothetical protein